MENLIIAIKELHGCKASYRESIEVKESFDGQIVWEGFVHIFDIDGHIATDTCFAWSSPIEGSDKRKIYAVLKVPPVDSPLKAVRAAIVDDYKKQK